jgi:hypothetical protein
MRELDRASVCNDRSTHNEHQPMTIEGADFMSVPVQDMEFRYAP